MSTPWSVFQDGSNGEPTAAVRARVRAPHAEARARAPRHNRGDGETAAAYRSEPPALAAPPIHAGPRPESIGGPARRRSTSDRAHRRPHPLPSRQFQALFDSLFKVLFIFPSRTCSLSVSRPYLALDGIHRPIWAAFPNNPTRRRRLVVRQVRHNGALTLSAPLPGDLGPGPPPRTLLRTTPDDGAARF
ncbi:hypothetical protein RND71_019108 [Anisodus tanguticus]|uniref:Protein TAR1 n=1 Tax=Anisodus tanguticus TaxID=243964 RepID=A0AAE1S0B3_9SOLA|nr:hypothetical protein RND71_019108 [Anisodus tanguticus]